MLIFVAVFSTLTAKAQERRTNSVVMEIENIVEYQPSGSTVWVDAKPHLPLFAGDRLRTGPRSRAVIRTGNRTPNRIDANSILHIDPDDGALVRFLRGAMYYFHRDAPGTRIRTPNSFAVIRGTEFHLHVSDDQQTTTLSLFDGEVEMQAEGTNVTVHSGEQVVVTSGQQPRVTRMASTAILAATNLIQWVLYYPGVLDVEELGLSAAEQNAVDASLKLYRQGDVRGALTAYPEDRLETGTAAESVLQAALLLSVGDLPAARTALERIKSSAKTAPAQNSVTDRLARSLERLIGAVQNPSAVAGREQQLQSSGLATEWLSESYLRQGALDLTGALVAARRAVEINPQFAFGWARVAELEFSFGRVRESRRALVRGLELGPRNAQAHALSGFLAAAENDIDRATRSFDQAIALDGALANAWLGRGLTRFRRGDIEAGREDVQIAVTLEPQRGFLRSYLAKAWSHSGDGKNAVREMALAKELDPADPTAWLYSALILVQENRVNDAIRDLEHSQALNNNRRVIRAPLLLDKDRAVLSANQAGLYRDAGMPEVSLREAGRAASYDYASYSSHLFLAQSYDALRDREQIDLRHENAFLTEYLLANLLSPAAVGTLTPQVSQQEYSRLFESDRVGFSSSTEYLSRGDWRQSAVQYGSYRDFSYSAEAFYQGENGEQPNSEFEQTAFTLRLKHQLTARDHVYFHSTLYEAEGGDVLPYHNPNDAIRGYKTKEEQHPSLLGGYHREWSPGQHTLLLVGRAPDRLEVRNPEYLTFSVDRLASPVEVDPIGFHEDYTSSLELYTAELQQIAAHRGGTLVAGGRFQEGDLETKAGLTRPTIPNAQNNFTHQQSDFYRSSLYGYEFWQVHSSLQLVGGLTYDALKYPRNFRFSPVSDRETSTQRLSPKVGFIYEPWTNAVVRAAYTRGLGGVSFDQSFRIEPSQVAGFNQAYRSIIPEAVAGANSGANFETAGLSLETRIRTGTYLGLSGEWLHSDLGRDVGVQEFATGFIPALLRERLDHHEQSLQATLNQLIGEGLSLGAIYRVSRAELESTFTGVPVNADFSAGERSRDDKALLHHLRLFALYNHPSGLFGQVETVWFNQDNSESATSLGDENLWQHNVFAGYRFARRRAEIRVGILNFTDEDYRLNPLNVTGRLPRERTFYSALQFNF